MMTSMLQVNGHNGHGNGNGDLKNGNGHSKDSPGSDTEKHGYMYQRQGNRKSAVRNLLGHVCRLDIDNKPQFVRQTNIVCTIGPSCDNKETLRNMILSGMNVARFNLTLGPFSYHSKLMRMIRELEHELPRNPVIGIAVDITAPTVRIGLVNEDVNGEMELKEGAAVELTVNAAHRDVATPELIWLDTTYFRNLLLAVAPGDRIFLDDGNLSLIVREKMMDSVRCLVEQGGRVASRVRCHIPRSAIYKYAVFDKYRQSVLFALENDADFVYLSFMDTAEDVKRIRAMIGNTSTMKLIVRIETRQAAKNIVSILEEADGVIICRADLGMDLPPQKVFLVQKSIIARCLTKKKPVMVMGQMMESMRTKPRPTRAEAGDVANAVLDGADGLILTVETSMGDFVVESVQTMHQICREAESAIFHERVFLELKRALPQSHKADSTHTAAVAAVEASLKANANAIIVVTTTGLASQLVSSYRPVCPVLAITRREKVARQSHLYRCVHPILYADDKVDDWCEDMDMRINYAIEWGRERGFFDCGDRVVILTGWVAGTMATNTVRIFDVPAKGGEGLHVVRTLPQPDADD